jgi:hypothetical protein
MTLPQQQHLATPATRRREVLSFAGVTLAGVAAAGVLASVDPHEPGHYPTCPFLSLTGLYCPGCGSLRALNSLLTLDPVDALARNPFTVAVVPLLLLAWVGWGLRLVDHPWGRRLDPIRVPARWIWGLLVVVCAFWVLRNLPGFSWLSPA